MSYVSRDGHWHLSVITLDGRELIRIEHDTFGLPGGKFAPVLQDRTNRAGSQRTAFGFLVADVASAADVTRYVALSELQEVR
ncbi:MAG TPA: hypothetical protein VHZ03_15730 [Trebonia sp.]|jgi:hypothetical protein|nr:hypothetical protein [Trebonia sp.]